MVFLLSTDLPSKACFDKPPPLSYHLLVIAQRQRFALLDVVECQRKSVYTIMCHCITKYINSGTTMGLTLSSLLRHVLLLYNLIGADVCTGYVLYRALVLRCVLRYVKFSCHFFISIPTIKY